MIHVLMMTDQPDQCIEATLQQIEPCATRRTFGQRKNPPRLKIAYLSGNLVERHPTLDLMYAMLLEQRKTYEVTLYHTNGIPDKSDRMDELAKAGIVMREFRGTIDGDVLIDVDGYTEHNSSRPLAERLCAVQVAFMGYPGFQGKHVVDYTVVDAQIYPQPPLDPRLERCLCMKRFYVPNSHRSLYPRTDDMRWARCANKKYILACEGTFMGSEIKVPPDTELRPLSELAPTVLTEDTAFPLPGGQSVVVGRGWFVAGGPKQLILANFCALNRITKPVMDAWQIVLRNHPEAVLWLIQDDGDTPKNALQRLELSEAAQLAGMWAPGVGPHQSGLIQLLRGHRVCFLALTEKRWHLKRAAMVDLHLDTYPYNGHTTTVDMAWMGVPTCTMRSDYFPGRVAASATRAHGASPHFVRDPQQFSRDYADHIERTIRQRRDRRPRPDLFDVEAWTAEFNTHLAQAFRNGTDYQHIGYPHC